MDHKGESPAREVTDGDPERAPGQAERRSEQAGPVATPSSPRSKPTETLGTQQGEWLKDRHAGITAEYVPVINTAEQGGRRDKALSAEETRTFSRSPVRHPDDSVSFGTEA